MIHRYLDHWGEGKEKEKKKKRNYLDNEKFRTEMADL